jgi:hypothetical protein
VLAFAGGLPEAARQTAAWDQLQCVLHGFGLVNASMTSASGL